ncbi:universal stress protein [Streptomyces sp. t39]|uniref:universal stress protein n=1 Tax=Streptomyces sp. t39 TaxID=1828156 RepID=UPI0011CE7F34|nr:universal stress protein [Streptomyces sp. t39]TXS57629.1 universal stress protein [Streptomyces sp. t39]
MGVVVWITEGTWAACVDAALRRTAAEDGLVLLHVTDDDVADAAHGAFAGLLGRGHGPRDPGTRVEELARAAAEELTDRAAARLGRPAERLLLHGRTGHEVVAASAGADLLVCGRDGDRSVPGPHTLGPATRYVVDHATCPVLLV